MSLVEISGAIAPLDVLQLPEWLDGRDGANRAVGGVRQVAADADVDAIKAWLARLADSPETFASYRKEAERLLLWAVLERGKALSSLTHEDFVVYEHFLGDPQPQARWVLPTAPGSKGPRKVPRGHPAWRPFSGPLSAASRRQAMIILNALFTWLVEAGYLAGNPLALSRRRARKVRSAGVVRYLDQSLWAEVKAYVQSMPQTTERDRAHYARARWLFTLFYLAGLRISEVNRNIMGDIYGRHDSEGVWRWWLLIEGKGSKEAAVPATSELIEELVSYRTFKGLSPYPEPGEQTPLLLPIGVSRKALTRGAAHEIVKGIFMGAAARLRTMGKEAQASTLEKASAHWMRHTAGTHMMDKQIDLRMVRDNLRHESIATTNQYVHTEEDARHAVLDEKHRVDW